MAGEAPGRGTGVSRGDSEGVPSRFDGASQVRGPGTTREGGSWEREGVLEGKRGISRGMAVDFLFELVEDASMGGRGFKMGERLQEEERFRN